MKLHLLLLFLLPLPLIAQAIDYPEQYYTLCEQFGIDPHEGESSFLTLNIPAGGRYEGMGTAFTSVTSDIGYLDSNPAASSFVPKTELTFLHNDWISDTNLESIAYTIRGDKMGFGMAVKSLYLPFTGYDNWGDKMVDQLTGGNRQGYYSESIFTLNYSYSLFRNYYFEGISLGGNFKAGYRNLSSALQLYPDQNALSLMGDVGLLTRFNFLKYYSSREKNAAFGITARNMGMELIENPDTLPTQASAGFSWYILQPLLISIDFNYPFNLDGSEAELYSLAGGFDLAITDFFSIQGGYYHKQGLPRLTMGTMIGINEFTLVTNGTVDLTNALSKDDLRFSVALKMDFGDRGRKTRQEKIQELYLEGVDSFADGELLKAISIWEECLKLDKSFTPAEEMITTAKRTIDLEEKMRDQQRVEN